MEEVVVDASVVVKWYINEDYSENARELRNMYINVKRAKRFAEKFK